VAAGLLVVPAGALQAVGLVVYAGVVLLSARRRPETPAVSPA
jgi:hypothetical protein